MNLKHHLIILATCFSIICTAQTKITGNISNSEDLKWVVLHTYSGVQSQVIAKAEVSSNGTFIIPLEEQLSEGMYRLVYNLRENKYIDIIYAQKNMHLSFDVLAPFISLSFDNSLENTEYYNALKSIIDYEAQLRVLNNFVQAYNKHNPDLYTLATQEYEYNIQAINKVYEEAQNNFTKIACEYLLAQKKYYPELDDDYILQNYYSKQSIFNYIAPLNAYVLQSPILNDIIVSYVGQLRNGEATTIEDYEKAVDHILTWAAPNESLSIEITNFLGEGFKMLDIPEMIEYIDVNYKANQCEANNDTNLQQRLQDYERLAIGKQAPEIQWTDNNGNTQLLSQHTNNYTVVAFWGSWCGSCKAILPSINEYLNNRNDVFALAVGLDDHKDDWLHEQTHYPNFTHIQAKEKWNHKIAVDYAIYATPTFYVLDSEKKIIGKAKNLLELKTML